MRINLHPCYSDKLILLANASGVTPSQYVKDLIMKAELDTFTPEAAQDAQGLERDDNKE